MSRYSLKPLPEHSELFEIALGWDPGLDTFFVTVFGAPDAARDPAVRLWRGTTLREITSVAVLLAVAGTYAEVPEELAGQLHLDRFATPHNPDRPVSKLPGALLGRSGSSQG